MAAKFERVSHTGLHVVRAYVTPLLFLPFFDRRACIVIGADILITLAVVTFLYFIPIYVRTFVRSRSNNSKDRAASTVYLFDLVRIAIAIVMLLTDTRFSHLCLPLAGQQLVSGKVAHYLNMRKSLDFALLVRIYGIKKCFH